MSKLMTIVDRLRRSPLAAEILAVAGLVGFWLWSIQPMFAEFYYAIYRGAGHHDAVGQMWNAWWIAEALRSSDHALLYCDVLNTPLGVRVLAHDVAFTHVALSAVLRDTLGPVGSVNAVFVASYLFGLLGTYTLLRRVHPGRLLCAVAAIIAVAFVMSVSPTYADLELSDLGWLAFALAAWLTLLRRSNGGWRVVTGLLIGVTAVAQMYYGLVVAVVLGIAALAAPLKVRPEPRPFQNVLLLSGTALGYGLAFAAAALLPSLLLHFSLGLVTPDSTFAAACAASGSTRGLIVGVVVVIFGAMAAMARDERTWFWWTAVTALLWLSLGPCIEIGSMRIPGPAFAMEMLVPLTWRFDSLARLSDATVLIAAVFVLVWDRRMRRTHALSTWVARLGLPATALGALLLAAPVMTASPWWPIPLERLHPPTAPVPRVPDAMMTVARDDRDFVVLDLTCGEDAHWSAYYQVAHGKPIAGIPLVPGALQVDDHPRAVLSRYQALYCDQPSGPPPLQWLEEQGVGYVIVHPSVTRILGADGQMAWDATFGGPITAQEEMVRVYRVLDQGDGPDAPTGSVPPSLARPDPADRHR